MSPQPANALLSPERGVAVRKHLRAGQTGKPDEILRKVRRKGVGSVSETDGVKPFTMMNSAQYTAYLFDSFTLDLNRGVLLAADGSEMPLRPKSFALLRLLLENAGRLLSRDTIMAALWPNLFVTDDNVTQCVRDVRRALGAEAQRMLRTQPRRGYLFTSEVVAVPAVAASPRYERVERYDSGRHEPLVAVDGREGDETVVGGQVRRAQEERERPRHGVVLADLLPDLGMATVATGQSKPDDGRVGAWPAERRQLTVVVCDVAGLAVLSDRLDLEDLREVTTACHRCCTDIIERYHGYVANYSPDGILAYFGYPQADEHDAERAIQAGLALAGEMPKRATAAGVPLHVAVGIATGLVVVGDPVGSDAVRTVTVTGSTTTLA
jgi:DNA-binding winged helix-turn-helix (wHTH) protein